MKSYTDLEQSKKLAEILPLESADMCYILHASSDNPDWRFDNDIPPMVLGKISINELTVKALPCWSLTALLGVIRETIGYTLYGVNNVYMFCNLGDKPWKLETEVYDNEIDVCCEMIIKLKELNLL